MIDFFLTCLTILGMAVGLMAAATAVAFAWVLAVLWLIALGHRWSK